MNSMIDDYAASGNAVLRVALAGKQQDGFFSPMRRVSPISVRVKEPTPADPAPKAQSAEPDAKKDPNLPQILPSPPAVTSDLAKMPLPPENRRLRGKKVRLITLFPNSGLTIRSTARIRSTRLRVLSGLPR